MERGFLVEGEPFTERGLLPQEHKALLSSPGGRGAEQSLGLRASAVGFSVILYPAQGPFQLCTPELYKGQRQFPQRNSGHC